MFVLAHLSDPHLAGWSVDEIGSLFNKRLTGWLSWRVNRRRIHLTRVLDLLVDDLAGRGADHVTVTGDLVNISLQQEFARAGQWLRRLGTGEHVTVIPGNHDAYVDFPWDEGAGRWAEFMSNRGWEPEGSAPNGTQSGFPFVRRLGRVALVGLSTALPMPPFIAAGQLGETQVADLTRALRTLGTEDVFRVVLIHHPPNGSVEIRIIEQGNHVKISVQDHGIGIDPQIRPRIFDRFFHIEKVGEELYSGVGIGLSITRQVIRQHRGTLDVDSEPGKGSTFTISLLKWK